MPLEVTDFDAVATFYGGTLGLPQLNTWHRDLESGAIFGVGASGLIEVVQTSAPTHPPPIALELPTWSDVDELADRVHATPVVHPRGHYGFIARDPDGNALLIWSEG